MIAIIKVMQSFSNRFRGEAMEQKKVSMKPVEKKSLYLKISDSIFSYIRMNGLQAGDKLPSEREMSAMLQTSRNSVREALRILEDRGIIYVKTGSGVFIKEFYGEKSTLSIRLSGCSLEDIQELQTTLDHQAVLNAIIRGSESRKQELVSVAFEMIELAEKNVYSHILDHNFHSILYECGKNNAIHQLITKIREDRFVRRNNSDLENDSVWLDTIPKHLVLANAILENNTKLALEAIDRINEYGFSLK